MKWGRLFIGGHTELTRPVHCVDEQLMRRIDEARRRLGEVRVKPVRSAARVRELEARKTTLELQMRMIDKPARIVPNVERMILARIERLEDAARDPERGERVASRLKS